MNTGKLKGAYDPKNIIGAIFTPKGYILTATQLLTLATVLQAGVMNAVKALRLYPIYGFTALQDGSEDITVQTMGYGQKYPVREGYIDWKFELVDGFLSLHSVLRAFNGSDYDFFFIDANNRIIGTAGVDTTGAPCFKAIPSDNGFFYAHPFKINDGSKISSYIEQFVFAPKYINDFDKIQVVEAGVDMPTNVQGLADVLLTSPGANVTSGSYNVQAATRTGISMGAAYATPLQLATSWIATNTATGLPIAITTVTYNAATDVFTFVLLKTDANYPTTGTVSISLIAPTALATAGVVNYESNVVSIAKN